MASLTAPRAAPWPAASASKAIAKLLEYLFNNFICSKVSAVPEEAWTREGQHPQYPPFSLNDQLFLACWHEQNHIEQITRILAKQ